ncbi:pentapeptide repeat-containing protein [Psychrobacter sp. Ps6]|nr:pentapeptide repeat-containing protein [Psychrobacter sp. Ps6]
MFCKRSASAFSAAAFSASAFSAAAFSAAAFSAAAFSAAAFSAAAFSAAAFSAAAFSAAAFSASAFSASVCSIGGFTFVDKFEEPLPVLLHATMPTARMVRTLIFDRYAKDTLLLQRILIYLSA